MRLKVGWFWFGWLFESEKESSSSPTFPYLLKPLFILMKLICSIATTSLICLRLLPLLLLDLLNLWLLNLRNAFDEQIAYFLERGQLTS
jgi:hypothetical protein